jgi:hypothetical protein
MRIPVLRGVIDRRILVNYRADPASLAGLLPPPFRPRLVNGVGVAGICLIRLKGIRPRRLPWLPGLASENAAHRVAVEWDEGGCVREGVYIPRRDTSSWLNAAAGGRLFPGVHHHARFRVAEGGGRYRVALDGDDGRTHVLVEGRLATGLPAGSVFGSLAGASAFFERGSLGYSATARAGEYDGLELRCSGWRVEPPGVDRVESSVFDDPRAFPSGTVAFDSALLMRGVEHAWHAAGSLHAGCRG